MRIAQRLHKAFQRDGSEFVEALYAELLSREADKEGLNSHLHAMKQGTSKVHICIGIVSSPEAAALYAQKGPESALDARNAAEALQVFHKRKAEPYVHAMFREILCREPDSTGYNTLVEKLNKGDSKPSIVAALMHSPEFGHLMGLNKHAFAKEILERLLQSFYV